MEKDKTTEERRGMLIGGLITLGMGIIFLLETLDIIPGFGKIWPLFPIIVGIALIVGAFVKGKNAEERDRRAE